MSTHEIHRRLIRGAVVELLRQALSESPGTVGATRELVRLAEAAGLEDELLDAVRAALALVAGGGRR